MTKKLGPAEVLKREAMMVARAGINVKHQVAAMKERNEVLPDLEDLIDNAILTGERLQISAADLFESAYEGNEIKNANNS